MKDRQTTLKNVLRKIVRSECISCGEDINKSIKYQWKIPLCKKCRLEAQEDIEEYS
jgi:hypothetical protein